MSIYLVAFLVSECTFIIAEKRVYEQASKSEKLSQEQIEIGKF
jgi:hypothetical protein